jgi:LAGLIDADG-like domain
MITLQGGTMQAETRKAIEQMTAGEAKKKNRVMVLEVEPAGGSLNGPTPQARVTVERFGCYSDDTEILTEDGWLLFKGWSGQAIATVNLETERLEYQDPIGGLQVYSYKGDLIEFPGAAHNALVTPNHNMVLQRHDGSWGRERADKMECRARARVLSAPAYAYAPHHEAFEVAGKNIPSTTFLKFLGLFIADGSTTSYFRSAGAIKVSVKKERKVDAILGWFDDLSNCGLKSSVHHDAEGHNSFVLYDESLEAWLRANVGTYAWNKRIPRRFLSLSTAQSQILLMAMFEGDAHHVNEGGRNSYTYSTVSRGLADDVQELALRCGWRATIGDDHRGCSYVSVVPGKNFASLSKNKIKDTPFSSRVSYDGNVYCFEVPNHTLITRRNGRVAIHGNSDRQKDSMFEEYDAKCADRILKAFRFSPIFIGQTKDFNFATAFASYTVGEAQVFKPERDGFDSIISMKLLPAMGYDGYRLKSKPLVIEDATLRLQGLEVISAMGDQVEPADVVAEVSKITGTNLKVSRNAPDLKDRLDQQKQAQTQAITAGDRKGATGQHGAVKPINPQPKSPTGLPIPGSPTPVGGQPGQVKPKPIPNVMGGNGAPVQITSRKGDEPIAIPDLALRSMKALRKRDLGELALTLPIINRLDQDERQAFDGYLAELAFIDPSYDPAGLAELAACTMTVMAGHHAH